uniref:InlB B-repeat-containing protein n=1 Tax=Gemmiger qucibialis TaxID=2997294 RepID=UPI003FED46F6
MKKNLQRFGASVLAAAMVAQSVALPAAAETTKIDSSVAQSVAASAASAASAVQSLPKFTSTADLIKQTAQTLAAQGEVHELEQDDAKLEATAQSKAGMSLAALENALADAMYANAAAGKINTEAYGLNKDEMASVMAATIKTYHLSSAVTDLGYETNAAGVVTAVTFTGSSGMTSAMESMTNSDDEVIAQQADSYAQAYVAENSDTFAASAAADGHTYGEPKWYWNDTNPEDGHTHTWKETPDGYWTKTDDGWAYTAVYTCEKGDAYQKVEGTVTKDTTEAKPGAAGKTVYSASVPADKSPVKKEYKEPTTRTDDIAALPCQNHAVPKDADGNFVATFNWEMKKVEGKLEADYSNAQLFYDSETGKISAGAPVTIDWECTSVTFKCAVCGEEIKTQPVMTMPVSVVVDQNNNSVYINVGGTPTLDTTSGGTGVTLVSAMDGGNWYDMQNNPVDASKVNFTYQSGDNKGKNSLLLYDSQKTAVYVDDQGNQVTNTYDVSTAQMNYYYFQLSQFNQDEAEYFGVVAPFWTSKGVQKQGEDGSITGTMGAIKILCSIDPNDDVPPTTMAFMLNMLPQAFMSYVMNYGEALKAIRDAGLAQVAKLGDADYVTKLLILHDWISQVAEFDMGSMGDITGGGNNDPIQTTAFGALLGGEIGAKGVEYGCICLGYAAAFNYMVQNLPDNKSIYKNDDGSWKTPDEVGDNAVVDFAQILYYCDTSDTSIAGNAFGGGMFNNVHYFNAVKVNKLQGDSNSATMTTGDPNKNWYYVDVCYDDVNTECMAQTRVENAGDMRHVNFLVSPSGLEGRYSKYYDYIDSLYDGYTYTKNKEPDKDDKGNVILNNGKPHYSYTKAENKNETRYTDTCYEDTWFTSICSPIYFDNNYFYYVDTTTNQNLYNNMRRQQSENGNNGNSGSGSSGNNSQMQQFMKKMQNQGPDTLEARPRNANYYIRKEDSSSSRPGGFSMSSFTKTDDPFDIILMYYNDLKETSSNFNDDDSNAKVLAEAGTIYKIDTSAKDKHAKVENNLNTECLADAAAKRIYPALVHSTALYDGKLYFNVNNAIYRMDPTTGAVEEVKEYNTVYGGIKLTKDKDGNMVPDTHFPGMSMVIMDSAQDTSSVKYLGTFKNHPLAGLTLRDSYSFATTTQQGQTVITGINTTKDQLVVSVGTNLSNTYKSLDELGSDGKPVVKTDASGTSYANRKSYKTESWNYNPSYNQNMGSSDEKNKNEEFMWCANLVETMPMSDMVSDLKSGETTNVTVEAWCDTPAYTQDRTKKYGLTKGEKKYTDDTRPKGHTWALDELETKSVGNNVYLCSDCHTATESTPHTVTLPDAVAGVTLTLGTTSNTYIKDDTVTLTVEKEGTDIVTVTAKNGNTDVALTEVQEAAQDEAAAQATTEKAKTVYTFTMPDGDVTINVTKAAKTYAVKVADANKDTLKITSPEADLDKVAEGTSVTVVATPKDGYTLTADGVVVTYGDNQTLKATPDTEKANTYTFAMPAGDATVSAAFEEVKKYNVTVAGTVENGTVGVEPKTAAAKDVVTVTVTPNTNFKYTDGSLKATYTDGGTKKEINDFKAVDGKENTYTFEMPAADVTVSAAFEKIATETYTVTVDKGGDGKVTVNGQETEKLEGLKSGDPVTLKIDPIDTDTLLTKLAGVTVTSGKVEVSTTKVDENTYTFTMPDGNVNVSVQFTTVEYSIVTTADPAEGGTITVTVNGKSELKRAPKDAEMAVTVTPNTGYELELARHGQTSITDKVKDGGTYTVVMSECNFEIIAEFKKIETTEPTNPSEEPQAIEAEERTVHGAAEKTTITAMAVFTCTDKNCASAQFVDATVKQTSGVTTAAVTFNGKDYTAKYGEKNGWVEENGKKYWYEKGVKQGTTGRGKEIYDPDSDAWYWLDAVQGGAMTVSKDVYQESAAGQWADRPDGTGKWVRYDENGHMIKGWQTTEKGTYYFDPTFGTMAKGVTEIDGVPCAFDQNTGIGLDKQWVTINGADYWYEKGVRQGLEGRGKEIYDPASDAWYWLDSVDQGKKATSKDVYQESEAGQWADRPDGTGKWVRYDAQGHMIKGWSADKRYYFDPIYGTMAKGDAVIDGRTYHFDKNTGIRQ